MQHATKCICTAAVQAQGQEKDGGRRACSSLSCGLHARLAYSPRARPCAAGELLKAKAEAGVRVLLMLWDDKTSLNTPYLRNGLMGVHDEARTPTPG